MAEKKIILQLCADTGSDTKKYAEDEEYEVILIWKQIGVENYHPPKNVYGIIANPVCLEFSTARSNWKARDPEEWMKIVRECQRIISECEDLQFWVIENPAKWVLKEYLWEPAYEYEPWWFGSPWTKRTALWGKFNIPNRIFTKWEDVPKIPELYTRPWRPKPWLAFMHKSAAKLIPEFSAFNPQTDMEFRSLCSQKFATEFKKVNQ